MKAILSEKVRIIFNSPKDTKALIKAIKDLDENKTKTKTKINDKNVLLLEVR